VSNQDSAQAYPDRPHAPYEGLSAELANDPVAIQALRDLQDSMNAPKPNPADVHEKVGALRDFANVRARVEMWFESPPVQEWLLDIEKAGL
jgi:hypothetical protein